MAHVCLADPVCARLSDIAARAAEAAGAPRSTAAAAYVAIEGPQFSTRAESRMYRAWGGDVIGMTAMPEARLAREAELPYAMLGMVTDYDAWREARRGSRSAEILAVMKQNAGARTADADCAGHGAPAEREAVPDRHGRSTPRS